jgi:uncharacterized protein YjhX (UPF0386 family)
MYAYDMDCVRESDDHKGSDSVECVTVDGWMCTKINVAIFLDTAMCSPYVNRRFGGMYHLHLQGRKSAE